MVTSDSEVMGLVIPAAGVSNGMAGWICLLTKPWQSTPRAASGVFTALVIQISSVTAMVIGSLKI